MEEDDDALAITFSNEDLQLGFEPHNRPLFDMDSAALLHVIDARTSYNMLLGRPWLHENGVIPSTLHQCFKYYQNGTVRKVVGDHKPFTEAESHFADAQFYLGRTKATMVERDVPQEESGSPQEKESRPKMEGFTIPLTKIDAKKPIPQSLKDFAYKLLVNAGYNPQESSTSKSHVRKTSNTSQNPKAGLGYMVQSPIRIAIKRATANYASTKQIPKSSSNRRTQRVSVFKRLDERKAQRISVFKRLGKGKSWKKDVTKRANELDITEKLRSSIPSRMKRCTTLLISCGKELKAKMKTIIFTRDAEDDEDRESVASSYYITNGANNPISHTTQGQVRCEDIVTSNHITSCEEVVVEEEDAEIAPQQFEEGVKATVDELREINLGTIEDPRPTYISALLTVDEEYSYIELLKEFKDIFAWSYKEMPGLSSKIAVHHLAVRKDARPVKQAQRRFRPELVPLIEAEVNKLINVGFIREVKYPTWISSIVPVRKKNGQIRVCVDFRDLNEACPKDDFPLPIAELMIDATTGHEALTFMDGSSGYNQIRMSPNEEELTAFRTPKGIYCYKVMPFGLKNAGATYQRAMQKIFDDILHKNVECYVDDLVVKSKKRNNHLQDLRMVFERLRKHQLKMNPLKCAFGVKSGKFLGFIVRHQGIEIEQAKIDAILKMPEPRNIHDLKSLQGKLAYLRRFISNLAGRCQPFSRIMKKGIPFEWDESCRNAFKNIKSYLMQPPVLAAPVPGRPLILYIAAQERSMGALLAQENEGGKENALYYLSRTMTPNELKYAPIEKLCLALIFSIQKLKHYFQAHTVRLISKANPLKFVMSRPVLSDRLARWYLQLQQFEIVYVPQKAVKGQVLADFLADHPIPAEWELSDDLPDEDALVIDVALPWWMFFDGASHKEGAGAGIVFVTPEHQVLPFSFTLTENCSNNVAEYQALILGLEMALNMQQSHLKVYGDSKLVVNQILGLYEVKKPELLPYVKYARKIIEWLGDVEIEHVPRSENKQADALAKLASTIAMISGEIQIPMCERWVIPPIFEEEKCEEIESHLVEVFEIEEEDWRQLLVDYLKYDKLPNDPRRRVDIRRRATRFIFFKGTLYRRSFDGVFLRCLSSEEAAKAMEEAHSGICGAHQSGPKLHFRIKRMGYYWPTMVKDCLDYAQRYQACQFHANLIHQPPEPLHPTVASWPFDAWGMDVVGPLTKSSGGHLYILAATDYFSKWAEAIPLREVKKETVAEFIKTNIIYRYGVPRYIITDNGTPFSNTKIVSKSKRDWHERIGEALWAYRTTYRTPTQATPYSLVYGVEAVIPLEQQIPSLRMAIQEGLTEEENARLRLEELEALDEKRLEAQQKLECYQARLSKSFNKTVRVRSFQVGDLVLAVRRPIVVTHRVGNKFVSRWDGPYVVKEVYTNGAYRLLSDDNVRVGPINGKFLKRYYP
ncbi:LOW QUALITY PROTEIN: uncharacterized protein LOC131007657 [Salvia miltiorrhiza]|uniref:LOW QUALITY PROTEIN: uncharacterized protein LOC131007657 n=1 Tax=Salvia miltiorrhiza TaxID=226208 RepID=UPI0025AD742D|nr:LOW QUALITY PROTEIN: uncharacterized protein LOC131007657 [Salvia miltiorrhiza]